MYWAAFVYHFLLASEISMLGTSIPLVMEFAKSHDMHPLLLGMIWTFSAGGKLFAYQSGVLIVGYSYGYFAAVLRLIANSYLSTASRLSAGGAAVTLTQRRSPRKRSRNMKMLMKSR